MRRAALLMLAVVPLASCESMQPHAQTAYQVLQTFCALHRAEITHVLLTQQQIKAGNIVCAAVGEALGT